MASKINDLPLNELYQRKITPSVEVAIYKKEDFSKISTDYCSTVCRLKCKNPKAVTLLELKPKEPPVDILIIQDHMAPKGKYDRTSNGQEIIQKKILTFICEQAGFQGLHYRITNLLKCAPDERDFIKGKAPSVTVLSKCKPYLISEIERLKPKVIISLSTAVTKALGLKKHSNTSNRGEIVNGNIVITLHPRVLCMIRQNASGKLWGNDYFNIIKRDFMKAAAIARGELTITSVEQGVEAQRRNIRICRSIGDVFDTMNSIYSLPDTAVISVDTETTGLDGLADGAKLLCIQFGWRDPESGTIVASVVPLWHRENKFFNPDEAWELIVPLLKDPNVSKVFHNGKFDILYTYYTTGVRIQGFNLDTMLLLHAGDSGIQGCLSLKTAIWDHCPEMNLGGYENLLPPLTKKKKLKAEDLENEDENDTEEEATED